MLLQRCHVWWPWATWRPMGWWCRSPAAIRASPLFIKPSVKATCLSWNSFSKTGNSDDDKSDNDNNDNKNMKMIMIMIHVITLTTKTMAITATNDFVWHPEWKFLWYKMTYLWLVWVQWRYRSVTLSHNYIDAGLPTVTEFQYMYFVKEMRPE